MRSFLSPRVLVRAAVVAIVAGSAGLARAQGTDTTYTETAHKQFTEIANLLVRTAEKVGPDLYSFKPTPDVRSLGAILGHVADDHMFLCKVAAGESPKYEPVHEKKTSKAEIVAVLKESVALCDSTFKKLNDASGKEIVTAFNVKMPKLGWLHANTGHDWEHYGNLVTYMRLKNIVPPSSEKKPGSN